MKKSSLSKLFDLFTPKERFQAYILILMAFLAAMAQMVGVAAIFPFINAVMDPAAFIENPYVQPIYKGLGIKSVDTFIMLLGVAVFFTVVFSSIVSGITIWAKTRFVLSKNHTLSYRLLSTYLSQPYAFFLKRNSNEMGKNVLSEVTQLTHGLMVAVFEIIISGLNIIIMMGFLLLVEVRMTGAAILIFGICYTLLTGFIRKRMTHNGVISLEANTERYRLTNEALSGIKATKVMNIEQYFLNNFRIHSEIYARVNIFGGLARELPKYVLEAVGFGGIVLYIMVKMGGGYSLKDSIPMISLFAFAGYKMMPALHRLYSAYTNLFHYEAVLNQIHRDMNDYEDKLTEVAVQTEEKHLSFEDSLSLENIFFIYEGSERPVLNGLSIVIKKNEVIGFVGTTGAGKTTLVDILLGLLRPDEGCLRVDQQIIGEHNISAWQRQIGYVPQDIYLSDDSIAHNIAFGIEKDYIDMVGVRKAARIAALDEFIINDLPDQYETVIGERGVRLSGGQRQRIGLARALYHNPEVLILDEATSSLDGFTEDAVIQAIKNASELRTVIMIAHRLTTLQDCDQIYIIRNGTIDGHGTYRELIESNELFMDMAKVN